MPVKPETLHAMHTTEDELIRMLVKDVRDVFTTMVGVDDILHLPVVVDVTSCFQDCITAMVGLAGSYNGLVSIHMPSPLALSCASLMLDMTIDEIDQDVNDAMGEIANMIAGSFNNIYPEGATMPASQSLSIVYGKDYTFNSGNETSENITLKFATDKEWFMVSLTLEE